MKPLGVTSTGAWVLPGHFKYHFDASLAAAIVHLAGGNSTLVDLGAGRGAYVRHFRNHGIAAEGFDGVRNIVELSRGHVSYRDLAVPFTNCTRYDWVTSLEVAEHIPQRFEHIYLQNLNCSCLKGLITLFCS